MHVTFHLVDAVDVSMQSSMLGKHTRRITCGAWNADNKVALGGEDRQVTISNMDGDTLRQIGFKLEPTEVHFSDKKDDEQVGEGSR